MGDKNRGRLIVFEGLDGCGKSTQLALLNEALRARGVETAVTGEPSNGAIGQRLRRCLSGEEKADGRLIGELFAADRYEHVGQMLAWLDEGKWVLCDRYYLSSLAYQGACLTVQELEALNRPSLERLTPDLTIYLRVSPEEAMERMQRRGKTPELFEKLTFLRGVAGRFDAAIEARREIDGIAEVDARPSEPEVAAAILAIALPLIEKNGRETG